jgi:hypothetical protein
VDARHRFDEIDHEQLAAQLVAVMNAHFQRPTTEEKLGILRMAERQLGAEATCEAISQRPHELP